MPVGGGEEKQMAHVLYGWDGFGVTAKGAYFLSDSKTLQLLDLKRRDPHRGTIGGAYSDERDHRVTRQCLPSVLGGKPQSYGLDAGEGLPLGGLPKSGRRHRWRPVRREPACR